MSSFETNGHHGELDTEIVVLRVEDEINKALTGHQGCRYDSPPQLREDAVTLARVLLGYTSEQLDDGQQWTCPIAGGRRTVTLIDAGPYAHTKRN